MDTARHRLGRCIPTALVIGIALLATAVPARAAVVGTGGVTLDVHNDLSFDGSLAFAPGTFNVFGAMVDLENDVGTMDITGQVTGVDLSNATFTMDATAANGFAFHVDGSAVCTPNCLFGTAQFVGLVSNVNDAGVTFPGNLALTFDGTIALSLGDGTGDFGLNGFQHHDLPTGMNVEVVVNDTYFNSASSATDAFVAGLTVNEAPSGGTVDIVALSNAPGALPAGALVTAAGLPARFVDITIVDGVLGGPFTVCVGYDDTDDDGFEDASGIRENLLVLLHRASVGGAFVDVTLGVAVNDNLVCGEVSTLSPFVVGAVECTSPEECDDDNPCTEDDCGEGGICIHQVIEPCENTTTTTTSTTTTTTDTSIETTTTTVAGDTTTTTTSTTSTTAAPLCGDGVVNGEEECDAGSPNGATVLGNGIPTCGPEELCASDCTCQPVETTTTTSTLEATTTTTTTLASTTTAAPSTSTTIATTTTVAPTTTTTLPTGCTHEATFSSILCRIDALIALVTASDIGEPTKKNLLNSLARARARVVDAQDRVDQGRIRGAKSKLKSTIRKLISFAHRVDSLTGGRRIPDALEPILIGDADAIRVDVKTLADSL